MTLQEIHSRLREKFGEAIAPWSQAEAGDSWIGVAAEALYPVCQFLKQDPALAFDYLRLITGVDWTDRISSVYHLYSFDHQHLAVLRVDLPRENPRLASVADLWPAADWHERETWDMMGISFRGHPNLKRILMYEGFKGHALRKDYRYNQRQPLVGPMN